MRTHCIALFAALLVALLSTGARAQVDPDAEFVSLRKDCTGVANCFEDDVAALNTWIWNTRQPTASDSLVVDIGPGDFDGRITCQFAGHVTFRGAGRERTILHGVDNDGPGLYPRIAVSVVECAELEFIDMTLEANIAVYWISGGTSTWTDVDVSGSQYSWYDFCGNEDAANPSGPSLGEHYWWGSRVTGQYLADCGQTWFYGSEILSGDTAIVVEGRGDVRLFGSAVRVVAGTGATGTFHGVRVGSGAPTLSPAGYGEFHMHGGIVTVDASAGDASADATALSVHAASGGDASAHTLDTAFVVKPGSAGTATRVTGNGTIASPLLWQPGTQPPVGGLVSLTGQDAYVETDCSGTGCDGAGTDPHLMLYKADCPGSPWFDVVRGACRD